MRRALRWVGAYLLAIICSFLVSADVQAIGVQPLVLELNLSPGGTAPFEIIAGAEDVQEVVDVSVFSIAQEQDGTLVFLEESDNPALNWVRLDSTEVVVPPGGQRPIRGEVQVPLNAAGTYVVAVMVEPRLAQTAGHITLRIRYAIRIVINVERPGLRPELVVEKLSVEKDEVGLPFARAVVRNPSPLLYPIAAEMTIRDENRALIERVIFGDQDFERGEAPSVDIYPGSELWLDAPITKPLLPGTYELRLFLRYAGGRQKVHTEQLTVAEGEFAYAADYLYLTVEPKVLSATLRPGGADSQVLQLTNNFHEPIYVALTAHDVAAQYPRSIFEHLQVELRGADVMEIGPRRSARAVLVVRAPREGVSGGYYGYITATAFSQEGDYLAAQTVELQGLLSGDSLYRAEILSAAVTRTDTLLFTVLVENRSEVHIAPRGVVYLRDSSGEILRSLTLELQEGMDHIYPGQSAYLTADGWEIDPGEYSAEIHISVGNTQIGYAEHTVWVPDSRTEER